ncbi:MAG: aldehyde dehydrogenase family protein [Bacillota bacterium]
MNTQFDKLFINGEWVKGSSENMIPNKNPFNNIELGSIKAASKEDLDTAYKSAQKAQESWTMELPQI